MIFLLFWILFLWRLVATVTGLLSKRELHSLDVIIDVVCVMCSITWIFTAGNPVTLGIAILCTILNVRWAWIDYKKWRDSDDDDDFRQRRRSKIKSHLPKPVLSKPAYIPVS